MLVDSEYVGDWMTSTYLPDGIRIDHRLSLLPDGGFVWRTRHEGRDEHRSHGMWRHDQSQQVLHFTPSEPGPIYGPDNPQMWRVLRIAGFEEANAIMVLRWIALASRNLPVLFYRVHARAAEPAPAPDRTGGK
jgi:hypothetical protein